MIYYDIASNMRLVLDTNVIVAALRSPAGASAEILRRVRHRKLTAIASVPLFLEYEDVLQRPEILKASSLSQRETTRFLDALASLVEPTHIFFLWRPLLKDPKDDLVLETAVNGRADALITFNTRHFVDECGYFGIETLLPSELLRRF